LDEIQSYAYELDDNYNAIDKIADKERYHLMDSMRYILSDFVPVDSDYGEAGEARWDSEERPNILLGVKHG